MKKEEDREGDRSDGEREKKKKRREEEEQQEKKSKADLVGKDRGDRMEWEIEKDYYQRD